MKVGKIDAARRQLKTAIRIYFSEGDPVATHTLAAATHQLLADLTKARGSTPMLTDSLLRMIRQDQVKQARDRFNAAANFFKHADRDPGDTHTFNPSQTEFILIDACYKYRELTGEVVPVFAVYTGWFWLGPGAKLVDVTQAKFIDQFRAAFRGESKGSFFMQALPMVSRLKL
jgi:hypothetical protein